MKEFTKRATSVLMAGAVVLGYLAFKPNSRTETVNAATLYDSASAVNYATILGDAVDYGITASSIYQENHMETTFATKEFYNENMYNKGNAVNNDIDYVDTTAQIIIGNLNPYGLYFGKNTASSLVIEAPTGVFGTSYDPNYVIPSVGGQNGNISYTNDFGSTAVIQSINPDASAHVESLISQIDNSTDGWSKFINDRATDSNYVLESSYITTNGTQTNININDEKFDNIVVYVNLTPEMVNSLSQNGQFHINKRPSTVVVFNIPASSVTTDTLHLNKPVVHCGNLDYVGTTAINGKRDESYGHGSSNGVKAADIQKVFNETVVWNVMSDKAVDVESMGGVMLFPKAQSVSLSSGNTSGWIVARNSVHVMNEFHFLYNGQKKDYKGEMHFSLDKAFTKAYAPESSIKQDTSITIPNGSTYSFTLQEYSDSSFKTTYGSSKTAYANVNSTVDFDPIKFTAVANDSSHYNIQPGAVGSYNAKTYYFRITENAFSGSAANISKSDGYINVKLEVRADSEGRLTYYVDYQTYTGEGKSLILYKDYSGSDKLPGAVADLGKFYNKVDSPEIDITKTIGGAVTIEDFANLTFEIYETGNSTPVASYKFGTDFELDETGAKYKLKTPYSAEWGKSYYVVEKNINVTNYTTVEASYTLSNGNTGSDTQKTGTLQTSDFSISSSDKLAIANFKDEYKSNIYGDLVVAKTAQDKSGSTLSRSASFEFTVKRNSDGKYLQSDEKTFGDSAYSFSVKAGSSKTFKNLPLGKYTVTEDTSNTNTSISGYKFDASASTTSSSDVEVKSYASTSTPVTFTLNNKYDKLPDYGDITVSKVALDENKAEIKGETFYFAVKNNSGLYRQADGTFSSSVYYFEVKSGSSTKIDNLPFGTYTIEEDSSRVKIDGYTFVSAKKDPSNSVTLARSAASSTVKLTNNYKKTANINITKTIGGAVSEEDFDNLTFEIYEVGNSTPVATYKFGKDFEKDNSGTYKLKTPFVADLNKSYYVVEKNINTTDYTTVKASYALSNGKNGSDDNKTGTLSTDEFSITTSGSTFTAAFTDEYKSSKYGDLTVAKTAKDENNKSLNRTFYFSVKNSAGKYLQSDEKTFGDSEYLFSVNTDSSKTFTGIPAGTYTVKEETSDNNISIEGYTFLLASSTTSSSNVVVNSYAVSSTPASFTLVNKYEKTPEYGDLKVEKTATDDKGAQVKGTFYFSIKNSAGSYLQSDEKTFGSSEYFFSVDAGSSKTIKNLPVGEYTVSEKMDAVDVDGYTRATSGNVTSGKVTVVKGATSIPTFTLVNKYVKNPDLGDLMIKKTAVDDNNDPVTGTFYFSVKNSEGKYLQSDEKTFGSSEYFFSVDAGSSKTIKGIPVGEYTVSENLDAVDVDGYTRDTTGNVTAGKQTVVTGATVTPTVTLVNKYIKNTRDGSLTISKVAEDEKGNAINGVTFYFSVTNNSGLYLQNDGTFSNSKNFFEVKSGSSKKIQNLAYGTYTITEDPERVAIDGYTFVSTTKSPNGSVTLGKSAKSSSIKLTNKYKKNPVIDITKTIGGAVTEEDFDNLSFEIYVAGSTTPVKTYKFGEDFELNSAGTAYKLKTPFEAKEGESYYVVEKNINVTDYTLVQATYSLSNGNRGTYDKTSEGFKTENFTLSSTDSTFTVDFVDEYKSDLFGDLTIAKTAQDENGNNLTRTFKFSVKNSAGKYLQSDEKTFGDTAYLFSVDAGSSKKFTGIPVGKYTITEDTGDSNTSIPGYTFNLSASTTSASDVEVKAYSASSSPASFTLVNKYTKETDKGSLTVTKVETGDTDGSGKPDTYQFTVSCGTNQYVQADGSIGSTPYAFNVKAGGTGTTITGLLLDKTYTVTEIAVTGLTTGYTCVASYDKVSVTLSSSAKNGSVKITNTYDGPTITPVPEYGSLTVTKVEAGTLPTSGLPSSYKFTVMCGSDYVQADGSLASTKYEFSVTAGGSGTTITGLELGKTYVVEEVPVSGISGFICSTTYSDSDTVVIDSTNKTASVEITNTYSPVGTPTPGAITVVKSVVGTTPEASSMPAYYEFTIMADGLYLQDQTSGALDTAKVTFKISANDSMTFTGLALDKTYTIEEVEVTGLPAGYSCKASYSTDSVTLTSSNDYASVVITNTFDGPTPTPPTPPVPTTGSLSVAKVETGDVPSSGKPASYVFYVKCGDQYVQDATSGKLGSSKQPFTVVVGSITKITGLALDKTYVVEEASVSGLPEGYSCKSSVSPASVLLDATNPDGSVEITNTYSYEPTPTPTTTPTPSPVPGKLSFKKSFGGAVKESEITADDIYFIIERTDVSSNKYLKADGTFTSDINSAHIRLSDMNKASGSLVWSKDFTVPAGEYKVTEYNQDIYVGTSKLKYVLLSSSVTVDTTTVSTSGSLELVNEYKNPGIDVTISKQDVAGKEIPHATLKLTSLNGYDLSGVTVVRRSNGEAIEFTLSDNNTAISFSTIENDSAVIIGLVTGIYELEETVTPEAYLTADKITIVLNEDGSFSKNSGELEVAGSPIVMIDKADPTYNSGGTGSNTGIPATGESTAITTVVGAVLLAMCAAVVCGLGVYRVKRKKS